MYRKSLSCVFAALLPLSVLRAAVKVLWIDTDTGFYHGAPLFPNIYAAVTVGALFLLWLFSRLETDRGLGTMRGGLMLEVAAITLGIVLAAVSAISLQALFGAETVARINALPVPLRILEHLLGAVSGVLLGWLSLTVLGGSGDADRGGRDALLPVLWASLHLIDRFMQSKQVVTASDQLLETLFWAAASLFFLAQTRCIAQIRPDRRHTIRMAGTALLLGVPLLVGQTAARLLVGETAGPQTAELLLIAAACFYMAAFSVTLAVSPETETLDKTGTDLEVVP